MKTVKKHEIDEESIAMQAALQACTLAQLCFELNANVNIVTMTMQTYKCLASLMFTILV